MGLKKQKWAEKMVKWDLKKEKGDNNVKKGLQVAKVC